MIQFVWAYECKKTCIKLCVNVLLYIAFLQMNEMHSVHTVEPFFKGSVTERQLQHHSRPRHNNKIVRSIKSDILPSLSRNQVLTGIHIYVIKMNTRFLCIKKTQALQLHQIFFPIQNTIFASFNFIGVKYNNFLNSSQHETLFVFLLYF